VHLRNSVEAIDILGHGVVQRGPEQAEGDRFVVGRVDDVEESFCPVGDFTDPAPDEYLG